MSAAEVAPEIFIGVYSPRGLSDESAQWSPGAKPGKGMEEAEAVCRHCLQF